MGDEYKEFDSRENIANTRLLNSPKKLVVTVCGGLNWNIITTAKRLPSDGETYSAMSFAQLPGGKGANAAIALHRLSHVKLFDSQKMSLRSAYEKSGLLDIEIRMVGAVGKDDDFGYGEKIKNSLKTQYINVDGVIEKSDYKSGVDNTWVEAKTGENRILYCPGANHALKAEEFQNPDKCFGPLRPNLVISTLEMDRITVQALLSTAKEAGIDTLLNPAPAQFLNLELYRGLTHLILNETEAAVLTGNQILELGPGFDDWNSITDEFLEWGVKHVIVTLGARGAFYSEEKGHGELVNAEKVDQQQILDTSGAG
ncbi:MAG: hypothetical protein Q9227_000004 [Pyrenula ochraceoflavens]